MSNLLVPSVKITETATSLSVPSANGVVLWVIWTSEKWTANTVYTINSVAEADTYFGSNYAYWATLVPMIKKAFAEWAFQVKWVSIWTPTKATATALTQWTLTADSAAWALTITVASATIYTGWMIVYVWTWSTYSQEERMVVATWVGTTVTFTTAFKYPHYVWELARIITVKVDWDYTSWITALESEENKWIVVCESNSDATTVAILTMCANSYNNYQTPCVFIRWPELADDATSVIANATTSNNSRCINVFPNLVDFNWNTITGWETASAVAWLIIWNWLPKLNHNFSEFQNYGWVASTITDMDALISGWVTPIALKYWTIHIVRFITTSKLSNWVPDYTWREASIRLNIDIIEKTISNEIRAKYMQKGNTQGIRDSIKNKITTMLDVFVADEILVPDVNTNTPAYRTPVVTTDITDNTKVNVEIAVSPWKPLNFITLNFKISI